MNSTQKIAGVLLAVVLIAIIVVIVLVMRSPATSDPAKDSSPPSSSSSSQQPSSQSSTPPTSSQQASTPPTSSQQASTPAPPPPSGWSLVKNRPADRSTQEWASNIYNSALGHPGVYNDTETGVMNFAGQIGNAAALDKGLADSVCENICWWHHDHPSVTEQERLSVDNAHMCGCVDKLKAINF